MSHLPAPDITEKEGMYVALFAEQVRRGLSLKGLARETEIPRSTLSWWKREIRRRESRRAPRATEFVPVTVSETEPAGPASGFEALLPNGVRLHVPAVFEESALHRLVVTLASAC